MDHRVFAIVVTFNPEIIKLRKQIESVSPQCQVVLVDNGSEGENLNAIREIQNSFNHCYLLSLESNRGIAFAQNAGVEFAMEKTPNIEYILTLDHDSVPPSRFVEKLVSGFSISNKSAIPIAVVGPVLQDLRSGHQLRLHAQGRFLWKKVTVNNETDPIEVANVNSSGSLISLQAFKHIGRFDETLFIDHVETEWCFRARSAGYGCFVIPTVTLDHEMGDDVVEVKLFGGMKMPYRSPLRHYYITRNSISLYRRSYVPLGWKISNVLKLVFTFAYFGFFSKNSRSHRRYILRGISDGVRSVSGKCGG